MTCAYDEKYLADAMNNLGEAFDYATNVCHIDMESFLGLFISTGFANMFSAGNPKVIVGLSGTELAIEILSKAGISNSFKNPRSEYDCSMEFWCGYILCYYQWKTGRSFKDIQAFISMNEIAKLYPILHEATEDKFVDTIDAIKKRQNAPTKLQTQRKICGLTQKELSIKTELNLRTLQQYETRAKDLSQAATSTVMTLARTLGCDVKDLIEV